MKKLLFSIAFIGSCFYGSAQLPNGSVAPNFTITDINGTSHTLYNYLDDGYKVILDFSATWCGPCWSFHQSNTLKTIWANHGPVGQTGVNSGTTDDVIVIFIEGDGSTTLADLQGTGNNTQGNWLSGVDYYVTNSTSPGALNNQYQVPGFPTCYIICPNRMVKRSYVGYSSTLMTATNMYNEATGCPAPASAPADVAMISFDGETEICPGDYTPVVKIQNNGTDNLTSATVTITQGGNTVSTGTYTGSLATYGLATITCSTISGFTGGALVATVTTAGDANAANGTANKTVTVNNNPAAAVSNNVNISVTTDRYASETTWEFTNAAGTVLASGGPWSNLTANGTTVRPTITVSNLIPNECYKFAIYDSYGDGLCCAYGAGSYSVTDAAGTILLTGGSFTFSDGGLIRSGVANLDELHIKEFNVYPNPASDVLNVAFETSEAAIITLLDLQGRVVATQNANGQTGTQVVEFAVNELAKGSYIVNISSNGFTKTQNVVVR
jgi:hypothetical protein